MLPKKLVELRDDSYGDYMVFVQTLKPIYRAFFDNYNFNVIEKTDYEKSEYIRDFVKNILSKSAYIGIWQISPEAKRKIDKAVYKEDAGRGYRKVVASPKPKKILELNTIEKLMSEGTIVIACGI